MVDDFAAGLGQRFGLGARAIPYRDVVAGLDQTLGHGKAHATHADPPDLLLIARGHAKTPILLVGCAGVLSYAAAAATACPRLIMRLILKSYARSHRTFGVRCAHRRSPGRAASDRTQCHSISGRRGDLGAGRAS